MWDGLLQCRSNASHPLCSRIVRIIRLLAHEIPSYLVPNFSLSGEKRGRISTSAYALVSKLHYSSNGAAKTKDCGLRAEIARRNDLIEGGRTNRVRNVTILERA